MCAPSINPGTSQTVRRFQSSYSTMPICGWSVEQSGFARVGIAHQTDLCHDAQLEQKISFAARLARLRETRRLPCSSGEIAIAQSAASAFTQNKLLPVFRQVGNQLTFFRTVSGRALGVFLAQINFLRGHTPGTADQRPLARAGFENFLLSFAFLLRTFFQLWRIFGRQFPHQRPAWNFDNDILSRMTIHAFTHAGFAFLRNEPRLIILRDEVIQVVIRLQNHAAAAPTVAAAGAALGNVRFAMERDATFAAVTGASVNFYFINEHALSLFSKLV
jgi:hypothetical protein